MGENKILTSKTEWKGDSGWSSKDFFDKIKFSKKDLIAAGLKIDTPS